MAVTFFSLPAEVRCQIYTLVFAGAHATVEFDNGSGVSANNQNRRNSFTMSSNGNLGFLQASKQCYADAIDKYHSVRTVRIRNLGAEGLEDFKALRHVYTTARTVELDQLKINDLSVFPEFPKLQRLVLSGIKMWGGNMVVQRGQSASEAFNDSNVLRGLFEHIRYSALSIEERASKYFPSAHIVINFRVGNQVLDKNLMRGIQDWSWTCSYDVKADRLDKQLAHRLVLW